MSTYSTGTQVTKVNVNGKVGSATVYEIATVTALTDLDPYTQAAYADDATDGAVYTLRKVGGKGKGGCRYTVAQLAPVA